MIPSERQDFIYRYVCDNRTVSIHSLVAMMNVSHMTVRRDIQILKQAGKVVIVSGGVRLDDIVAHDMHDNAENLLEHRTRNLIGNTGAAMVEDGQVVYIDAGTMTFEIAKALAEKTSVTIITNDFCISQYLIHQTQVNIFHVGGLVDKRSFSSTGISAANFIKTFNIDIAFISSDSWGYEHGISTTEENKVIVKQSVLDVSQKTILVADSIRYGKYGLYSVCPLQTFDAIITDSLFPEEEKAQITRLGVDLKICQI